MSGLAIKYLFVCKKHKGTMGAVDMVYKTSKPHILHIKYFIHTVYKLQVVGKYTNPKNTYLSHSDLKHSRSVKLHIFTSFSVMQLSAS